MDGPAPQLQRLDEDALGEAVFHHPVYGPAIAPPPTVMTPVGPIDFGLDTPDNMEELIQGVDDIGEVYLPPVDKRLFDNLALASINPTTANPGPIIRRALNNQLTTSYFRLAQCSLATTFVIFRSPQLCIQAINIGEFAVHWEGEHFTVRLAPHDMADNRVVLDRGYLVSIDVLDFPVEYWNKDHITAAFYPIAPVALIEHACLTGADFSTLSIVLHLRNLRLPRRLLIASDGIGTTARIIVKGILDLNDPPVPPSPSPPYPSSTSSAPASLTLSSSASETETNTELDAALQASPNTEIEQDNLQLLLNPEPIIILDSSSEDKLNSPDFLRLSPVRQNSAQLSPLQFNNMVSTNSIQDSNEVVHSPPLLQPQHLEQNFQVQEEEIEMIRVEPEYSGPRRSERIREQTGGMYINTLEKVIKKKEKLEAIVEQRKRKKARNEASTSSAASEAPPYLTEEQMLLLGKEMGFDELEEGEFIRAAAEASNE